jgi:hypothetical protein
MSGGGGGSSKVEDTPEQRYAAQVAAEKWNFAQETLAPLENKYMDNVDKMDSAGRMSYLRGVTNQASQDETSQGLRQVNAQLGQAGINPNSGKFTGTQGDLAEQAAQKGGETMGRAEFQQKAEKITGLQNVTAMGSGQSTQAQTGLNAIANQSAADARDDSVSTYNRKSANLQLLGSLAGAGARYGVQKFGSPQAPEAPAQPANETQGAANSLVSGLSGMWR